MWYVSDLTTKVHYLLFLVMMFVQINVSFIKEIIMKRSLEVISATMK